MSAAVDGGGVAAALLCGQWTLCCVWLQMIQDSTQRREHGSDLLLPFYVPKASQFGCDRLALQIAQAL